MLLGEQPFMNVAMAPPIALGWCIRRSWGIQIPHFGAAAHDSFQNKMAQKNRFLPDESAWPFVYPQTLGGHLYNLSTNCHFLSSPKKCHGWIFTSYRCFFEFVRDWVIEWFLSPAFKRGIETKKTQNHRWAVCFWSYSDCVCWHLSQFFCKWLKSRREIFIVFPDFLFGQDGRFGTTLFDHPQFISSCGRTCGEWTISVHLFFWDCLWFFYK